MRQRRYRIIERTNNADAGLGFVPKKVGAVFRFRTFERVDSLASTVLRLTQPPLQGLQSMSLISVAPLLRRDKRAKVETYGTQQRQRQRQETRKTQEKD